MLSLWQQYSRLVYFCVLPGKSTRDHIFFTLKKGVHIFKVVTPAVTLQHCGELAATHT